MTMLDTALTDETQQAVALIESCLKALGGDKSRALWSRTEIDPVINDLLELWSMFHIPTT